MGGGMMDEMAPGQQKGGGPGTLSGGPIQDGLVAQLPAILQAIIEMQRLGGNKGDAKLAVPAMLRQSIGHGMGGDLPPRQPGEPSMDELIATGGGMKMRR